MKVGVIGGSKFKDEARVKKTLDYYKKDIDLVVSGAAKGADTFGENWAKANNIKTLIFPADWEDLSHPGAVIKIYKYGKKKGQKYDALAGMRRNTDIVNNSNMIIAFWDGVSPGTKDSINKARLQLKPVLIIHVDYKKVV